MQVVQAIEQRLHLLDRLPRVRIIAWLKKLKEEVCAALLAVVERCDFAAASLCIDAGSKAVNRAATDLLLYSVPCCRSASM